MKRVEYFKYEKREKVRVGIATFHRFGCNYEEFEDGVGNYSTAIIELENGQLLNLPVEMIRFLT